MPKFFAATVATISTWKPFDLQLSNQFIGNLIILLFSQFSVIFLRPRHFSAYIVPPFARPIPSVCLSVRDKSEHYEKGEVMYR